MLTLHLTWNCDKKAVHKWLKGMCCKESVISNMLKWFFFTYCEKLWLGQNMCQREISSDFMESLASELRCRNFINQWTVKNKIQLLSKFVLIINIQDFKKESWITTWNLFSSLLNKIVCLLLFCLWVLFPPYLVSMLPLCKVKLLLFTPVLLLPCHCSVRCSQPQSQSRLCSWFHFVLSLYFYHSTSCFQSASCLFTKRSELNVETFHESAHGFRVKCLVSVP